MPSSLINRDLISINDLTKNEILFILQLAKDLKAKPQPTLLQNKVLASLFFEPSTRTRLSFETAMERLGGRVIGFADKDVTSASKGETLYDSIRIIGQYADVIAMRHPLEGSARRAAEATDKPILNGGDGANQHPTQTLLDLFTIQETQKKLTGLSIALAGDLKYGRTVHSLMQALLHFSPRLYFIAPKTLQMPEHYLEELKKNKIKFSLHEKMEEVIKQADIFYLTRIQKERFADSMDYERVKNVFRLTLAHLIGVKKNLKILHPLPRVNELDDKIDTTSHAYYFQQAENGLYVRQALLGAVLGKI
ncbi:MAG TPA: aspartate carbamoyltransferase [Candidatus Magasanikbacteria bacterium]|uniref:Aspartate carbamoyltransferase n=1 Tax=Candidatus Magasanikbacteria bacterium GW2011_GWA2_41_55 TaxID=1619038 RepID=A0A0G0WJX9_9BACT|nr:MAG: Aspartate carbamoyltransferase [Candidatus Magasanikbacteria bacterium GW2011_GWA2_41_55]HBV58274.1 aspartate carbamoyltransferase [Candidatus Magasanikbacteria bacterium]HBX16068.1 aspartate carbamoyltransferase [Candidatus Magasanikbacteria bacterium]